MLVLFAVSRQNGDPPAAFDQPRDEASPEKSGAAENGYGLDAHRISVFESIARWSRA
jgi:hypothetical protein